MTKKIPIMVTGLPGNMATLIAKRLLTSTKFELMPFSFTGPDVSEKSLSLPSEKSLSLPVRSEDIALILPAERHRFNEFAQDAKVSLSELLVVDFTHPTAVVGNVDFYCDNGINFVMGTTGGKRELLPKLVEASRVSAVIATNMSIPIVMLMDMFEFAAENYAGSPLQDWQIRIVESHQSTKADVSGTALAIGKLLKNLGVDFNPENIRSVRDEVEQRIMGVPELALGGHGWHKYSLRSPDYKVTLDFEHNINGRDTYVDGTLMALDFLAKKVTEGVRGVCYGMKDVMRG